MKIKILVTLLLLVLVSSGMTIAVSKEDKSQTPEIETNNDVLFRDDFDDYTTNWRILSEFTTFCVHRGMAELNLWKAWRSAYFNIGINSVEKYQYNTLELRAQVNNSWTHLGEEGDIGPGSVGWGFWNKEFNPSKIAVAWFFHNEAHWLSPMGGLWAVCKSPSSNPHGGFTKIKIEGVDITKWHEYKINWSEETCDFYIDDECVAHITEGIPVKASCVNVWNDNAVWYALPRANIYFPIMRNSPGNILFLDYVELSE